MNRPFVTSLAFFLGAFTANLCGHYLLTSLLLVASAAEFCEALHRERARLRRDARVVRRT